MDDDFKTVYRILKILKDNMDNEDFDTDLISAKRLKISLPKWSRLIKMMADSYYITGVTVQYISGQSYPDIEMGYVELTLIGMEYLSENSVMQRIAKTLKGIKESVPGL